MDIRKLKTREAIKTAFVDLLKTNNVDKITVNAVAKRARINRSTFYGHYSDIPDLMNCTKAEIKKKLTTRFVDSTDGQRDHNSFRKDVAVIIDYIEENRTILLSVISGPSGLQFLDEIVQSGIRIQEDRNSGCPNEEQVDLTTLTYSVYGMTGVVWNWMKDNIDMTKDDIVDMIVQLTFDPQRTIISYK